ncbi:MAG TPA: nucleotidyltransferase domain-containing protein [Longilinea sp.]|nr:nucleotidyltransferase domain-containing protein [Longilinea sp.]
MNTSLPPEKQRFLDALVARLSGIPGMAGIALGGSWARGYARPDSDMDVALYYHAGKPFAIEEVRKVAEDIHTGPLCTVTDFYGWGPWVKGGAWIDTEAGRVDFIYRSLEHVQQTITEASQGIHHHDFGQQPPFGFFSVTYLGETKVCIPLFDPNGSIENLKRQVTPYPAALKQKLLQDLLWMIEFTFTFTEKFITRGDIYNTTGCLTRAAVYMVQVLFALNETYFINDKTALIEIDTFEKKPHLFTEHLQEILGHCGATPSECGSSLDLMRSIFVEIKALC